ncbi:MAG: hypothetical protein ACK4L4_19575 [Gemmobacter sp.]
MRLAALGLFVFSATGALADERTDTITRCVSAFATGDTVAYAEAAAAVRSWGEIADANLRQAALACLALVPETVSEAGTPPVDAEAPVEVQPDPLDAFLSRLDADPASIEAIAADVAAIEGFAPGADERTARLEAALLDYVRPLPAAKAEANRTAYMALSRIAPENATYREKVAQYDAAIEAQARADEQRRATIVNRLIKTTAEFDGSSWYRHPSSPRYQDTRSYVTLYITESGTGQRALEFFLNFTSRSGWLFVESAQINVDGDIVRLPPSQWMRDNDTEIWEWTGYTNHPDMIDLARRIADSKRSVVRFNGQQFYDDHVISSTEKTVIRDMLLAWEAMQG